MQLQHLLARQAGVVTVAQAIGCGVSAPTVQRWARDGRWRRLHPSVYLAGGHRLIDEARIRAAWLWAGADHAVVTGPAAAFWQRCCRRPRRGSTSPWGGTPTGGRSRVSSCTGATCTGPI